MLKSEKIDLVNRLLPMVNDLVKSQTFKIVAAKTLTFNDLMELNPDELRQLEKELKAAQRVQLQQKKGNDYEKSFEVKLEHPAKQHKIIC